MSDFKFDLTLHCGDWASYHWNRELAYCGWMSFHTDIDSGATKSKPMFTCEVLYADEDAVFVYREDRKYKSVPVKAGDTLHFDATKAHALLPKSLAEECIAKNSTQPQRKLFKSAGQSTVDTKVRLVWKWKE